jgi:hypothetical protein
MAMSQTCTASTKVLHHGRSHSDLGHGLTTAETYETSLAVLLLSPTAGA